MLVRSGEAMAARADSDGAAIAREWLLLGIVRGRQGKLQECREALSRAHGLFFSMMGENHAATATAATHLARVLLDSGRLPDAQGLFNQALNVLEANPPNKLVLSMALNGFGRLLIAQDRHAEAMPYLQRAHTLVVNEGGGERYFLLTEAAGGAAPALRTKIRTVGTHRTQ